MALINCPFCGNAVSDKAEICPNCGETLINKEEQKSEVEFCADCGTPIPEGALTCPKCGCPVETESKESEEVQPQKVEITAVNMPTVKKSAKKYVAIVVSIVVLIAIGLVVAFVIKGANEKKAKEEYSKNLKAASLLMLTGAAQAEEAGNLTKAVWYNTIYEKRDSKTDKYTRSNGYWFNDDFNDSLNALFSDSDFQSKLSSIKSNQESVASLMKLLQNPPDEFDEAYQAIKEYYNAYLALIDLAINPTGSYQTFSSNFNDADSEVSRCYKAMDVYIN
ncbi:MAG: zinc ribbon domain-containing protein [Clostridiaceae bacterium]|nr:zinc ribbon domain-containing protein [Clostridiaceae bacterium]